MNQLNHFEYLWVKEKFKCCFFYVFLLLSLYSFIHFESSMAFEWIDQRKFTCQCTSNKMLVMMNVMSDEQEKKNFSCVLRSFHVFSFVKELTTAKFMFCRTCSPKKHKLTFIFQRDHIFSPKKNRIAVKKGLLKNKIAVKKKWLKNCMQNSCKEKTDFFLIVYHFDKFYLTLFH